MFDALNSSMLFFKCTTQLRNDLCESPSLLASWAAEIGSKAEASTTKIRSLDALGKEAC